MIQTFFSGVNQLELLCRILFLGAFMKKILIVVFMFLGMCVCLYATSQLYNSDSIEVKTLESLYREAGLSMPGFIYPASGDVLLKTIERTGLSDRLSEQALEELDALIREFNGENLGIKVSDEFSASLEVALTPELFYISKTEEEYDSIGEVVQDGPRRDWVTPYNEIEPAVYAGADLRMTDYFFGHFEYELSKLLQHYHKFNLDLNIPYLYLHDYLAEENQTWPWNVYLSGGTGNFNAAVGRMRVSSGSGVTGNLSIGDNFMYRETFKFTVNAQPFTYEMLINTFSHEGEIVKGNSEIESAVKNFNLTPQLDQPRPVVVIHKATFNLMNKINLGLYEAILDYTTASPFDPQIFNPFALMHNWVSFRYNTNNWFGFDFDYAFAKGWSLNFQGMFDQIQQSDEQTKGSPNIYGFLLNVKNTSRLNSEFKLNTYAELTYTSPGMYLKPEKGGDYVDNPEYYKVDLVAGNYQMWCSGEDVSYLGYKYGPNTFVAAIGAELVSKTNTARLDLLYKASGDKGLFVDGEYHGDMAPYGVQYHGLLSPHCYNEGNVPQHLIRIALSDTKVLFDGVLEVSAGAALQHYINYKFQQGVNSTDVQLQVALKFKPLSFFSWGK